LTMGQSQRGSGSASTAKCWTLSRRSNSAWSIRKPVLTTERAFLFWCFDYL
jgi:hypothetical protein